MSGSEAISIISVIVALLSAVYARWAWVESKKANQLNLHTHQKEIYDAFFELKMHMTQKWDFAEMSVVGKFYYPSKNSVFYFEKQLANELTNYFQICFNIADENRTVKTTEKRNKLINKAKEADNLAESLEKKLVSVVTVA